METPKSGNLGSPTSWVFEIFKSRNLDVARPRILESINPKVVKSWDGEDVKPRNLEIHEISEWRNREIVSFFQTNLWESRKTERSRLKALGRRRWWWWGSSGRLSPGWQSFALRRADVENAGYSRFSRALVVHHLDRVHENCFLENLRVRWVASTLGTTTAVTAPTGDGRQGNAQRDASPTGGGNSDRACDQVGRFRDRPTSVAKPLKPWAFQLRSRLLVLPFSLCFSFLICGPWPSSSSSSSFLVSKLKIIISRTALIL